MVLQHAADYSALSATLGGLLIDVISGKILAPSMPNRRTPWLHLVLDELAVLGRVAKLPKLLNVGREKGVRTVASTQDWEQITKLYGREDAATLEARFKVKVVCQLGISETRDRVVERFGGKRTIATWETVEVNGPKVRRETETFVIEPELLSDELGVRETAGQVLVRCAVFGLGNPAVVDIPFTVWPERREAHMPVVRSGRQ
jgi:hypothetical protein